jgi:hypothetical protein
MGEVLVILSALIASGALQRAFMDDYSITSSARNSTDGGIVRPSALAVFRLMTN